MTPLYALDRAERKLSASDLSDILSRTFDGIALWQCDPWRVVFANPAFWASLGGSAGGNKDVGDAGDLPVGLRQELLGLVDRFDHAGTDMTDTCLRSGDGRGETEIRLCRIAGGRESLVAMIVRDRSADRKTENGSLSPDRLDPLTGLPDREFLISRMAELLQGERVSDRRFAVLFLDLDNFKQVNDEFGHLCGDAVLRAAARRIEGCLRERDFVARYGGDEFVAIIEGITLGHEVRPVIQRIQTVLSRPIELPECRVSLTLSAGVALASGAGGTPEDLLEAADRAMYHAKRSVATDSARGG